MKFLPLFLLLLPSLLLAATTTKRYTPPNFTTLKVLGPFQTILTQNQNTSAVIVTADSQKLVNLVVVEWRNRSLLVRVKENTVVDLKSFKSLKVYVSASRQLLRIETGDGNYLQGKNLRFGRGMEIVVSGSSTMQFNSLNSPTLSITCSGSSTLSTSHLTTTKNLTIQASGSSHIRSNSGSIQNLSAYLTGSSTLDLGSTIVNNANLEAVATSSIDVFVGRRARARATLVSTITVRGNAIVEKFVDMLSSVNVEGKGVGKGSNGK